MEAVPLTYFLKYILEIPSSLDALITAFILQRVVKQVPDQSKHLP